jgi:predicted secreted protein
MARNSKMIIAAVAATLVATLGVATPASAAGPDKQTNRGSGGGWCC